MERPAWLVRRVPAGAGYQRVNGLIRDLALHTVCQSAHCPNLGECFSKQTATFLILGGICTRRCTFCAVPKGRPAPIDETEAEKVAVAARQLGLNYVVITSVTRDDLPDGGAGQFAACIAAVRHILPQAGIEVLTPDFQGNEKALEAVLAERPTVFNHNIETIPRLYSVVRPGADYQRSLTMLSKASQKGVCAVKSGLMVGLGETEEEIKAVFYDLAAAGVTMVTIGQYLQPSPEHVPVAAYIHPERFNDYAEMARQAGIPTVAAGPFVRSSYQAGEMVKLRAFGANK